MTDHAPSSFTEALCSSRDAAATGFVLAHLDGSGRGGGPILWVQDACALREAGLPCLRGIEGAGLRTSLLRVTTKRAVDALWAMEEGLGCAALSAVVGEIWGRPRALDLTATKRLALRSRASGVPVWLLRPDGEAALSAAPERWHVAPAASDPNPWDARAPGAPRWLAELFRSRSRAPGAWVAGHDRAAHRVDLAAPVRDGALAAGAGRPARDGARALGGARARA